MNRSCLTVRATLDGHVVRGRGQLTLDALLASALFDRTGNVQQAIEGVPIRCDDRLFWASRAYFDEWPVTPLAMVQSMKPDDIWLDPANLKKNKHGALHRKFESMPDAILNTYEAVTSTSIHWYCTGDQDAILDLLQDITHIGKKRTALVLNWELETGDLDGLHGYLDEPIRPVPIDRWDGDRSGVVVDAAWAPAYWDVRNRTACFV